MNIKNTSRECFVLNLARGADYGDGVFAPSVLSFPRIEADRDGIVQGVRILELELPSSITWLPGETREVPSGVSELADFMKARGAGILRIV